MFYYRKGDLSTNNPWNYPTIKVFEKWLDEWSIIPGVDNYDLYMTGGFAQKYYFSNESLLDTWDIDIMLLKKPNTNIDYFELKNILDEADKIAWKNSLLVDARCIVNGLNPIEEGVEYKFKDPTITILNHKIIEKIGFIPEDNFIQKREEESLHFIELIPGLFQTTESPKESYKKFKFKNYKGPSYIRLTPKTQPQFV
jgi:hypothetical protein